MLKVSQLEQVMAEEWPADEAPSVSTESVFSSAQLPETLFKDLLSSYRVKAVIDLSPGQGEFAQACLSARVAYLAVCCTEAHCAGLEHRLTQYVMDKMALQGHPLYRQKAAAFAKAAGDEAKSEDEASEKDIMENKKPKKETEPDTEKKGKGKKEAADKKVKKEKESKEKKEKGKSQEKEKRGRTSEASDEGDSKAKKKRTTASKAKGKRADASEDASSSSASTMPW